MLPSLLRRSLQARLNTAVTATLLLFALATGIFVFADTYLETNEFQDDLLKQAAAYITPDRPLPEQPDIDDDVRIYIDTPGSPAAEKIDLSSLNGRADGFYTLKHGGDRYRVYRRNTPHGAVTVWQENEFRQDLAEHAAWNSVLPILLLIPLVSLLTVWIVRRALLPVAMLSDSSQQRSANDLHPLAADEVPKEVQGFVQAVNRMLARTDQVLRQQQRFIADAAHELRTPMAALSLQADRLRGQGLPEALQAQLLGLQQGIRRNRHLLEQLLSHARAQTTETKQPCQWFDARALLHRVVADLLPLAEQKNQNFGIGRLEALTLYADETDFYTMVKVLADNAVRYTPEGGKIDVGAYEEAHHIVFYVEDNGKGIAEAERGRVFEPFYRILGNGEEGTGLGLPIAETIAGRYGGYIELRDRPPMPLRGCMPPSVWTKTCAAIRHKILFCCGCPVSVKQPERDTSATGGRQAQDTVRARYSGGSVVQLKRFLRFNTLASQPFAGYRKSFLV